MLLLPFRVEVRYPIYPLGNLLLIAFTVLAFSFQGLDALDERFVLTGWRPSEMIGSVFLHAGILHLAGNMLFLWVFGNAICAHLGNLRYVAAYLLFGIVAAVVHLLMDGAPAVGASGAVNGMLGMYLALFPVNRVHCFWFFFGWGGTSAIRGYILIGVWAALDLWGGLRGGAGIAYWAHLGGLCSGLAYGVYLTHFQHLRLSEYDNPTLVDYFRGARTGLRD
jgi:membrane associated rhomboid family serine protease